MKEIGFSDSARELLAIATGFAIRQGADCLATDHIEYALFRRPDLFREVQRNCPRYRDYELIASDSSLKWDFGNSTSAPEKMDYSKELRESIAISIQKAREESAAEITPKFLLYGILKSPNTNSHKSLIARDPHGKSGLPKFLEGYFWGKMFDEDEFSITASDLCRYGRYEDAIKCCRRALEIAPDDPYALYQTIQCLNKLEGYSEALEYAEKLLRMDPAHPNCLLEKISCLYYLGRFGEVLKTCDRVRLFNISDIALRSNAHELARGSDIVSST